jgi:LPXTG-motif cell wall-anchored protein
VLKARAWAGHFTPDTGNTGGGDTLLIVLGAGLVLGLLYVAKKKVRQRILAPGRKRVAGLPTALRTRTAGFAIA